MKRLTLAELAAVLAADLPAAADTSLHVSRVSVHSQCIPQEAVFFALPGAVVDGHQFVADALANGAAAAVVARRQMDALHSLTPALPFERLLIVEDTLAALQHLAAWWRGQWTGCVAGIAGSNGKTLVKDALRYILSHQAPCAASPGGFNSQVGVPLSILRVEEAARVLLEAGISEPGEMERLERIIRPDCGLLTNVGWRNSAAFGDQAQMAREMMRLFAHIPPNGWVLLPADVTLPPVTLAELSCRIYRFGGNDPGLPRITLQPATRAGIPLTACFPTGEEIAFTAQTNSQEIAADLSLALCAAFLLGVSPDMLASSLAAYTPLPTRLETWKTPTGVTVLYDTYNAEPLAIQSALQTLAARAEDGKRRLFVFGGLENLGWHTDQENAQVGALAARQRVDVLLLLGDPTLEATRQAFLAQRPDALCLRLSDTEAAKTELLALLRTGDTILIKGPRRTDMERIARDLVEAMTPNRFYLDVKAVEENVARFRRLIGSQTRLLAMLKALAYGSDALRLARELQTMGVDCIGVSSADEGRQLRLAGIDLPILVMMCTPDEAEKLPRYDLTPVLYSPEILAPVLAAARAQGRTLDAHLELDTGMARLGVRPDEALKLAFDIRDSGVLRLRGLMTHFAAADDPAEDDFTRLQLARLLQTAAQLRDAGFEDFICHAGATAGTVRFPEARLDMVRVGLGLYGLYGSPAVERELPLVPAVALVSRIVKINALQRGDRIGYGGTFAAPCDGFRAAVVPMGYHDGIPLGLSNRGVMLVNGRQAPLCGRVSMDSLVVDVTAIADAHVGTEVLIYGERDGQTLRPEAVATAAQTIVYELLARLGPRVQRIFLGR